MEKVKTLVLIHGINTNNKYFEKFKNFFENKGYRIIAPNLPYKNNLNELGKVGIKNYLDFLEKEVKKIKEPFYIIGHSMGGLLAQMLAQKGYGEKIVLLSPAPPADISSINLKLVLNSWNIIWSILFFRKVFIFSFTFARKNIFNLLSEKEALEEYQNIEFDSLKVLKELTFGINTKVDEKRVKQDILILVGEKDRMIKKTVFEKINKKYKNSELKFFPNHSHYLLAENAWEEVAKGVLNWF